MSITRKKPFRRETRRGFAADAGRALTLALAAALATGGLRAQSGKGVESDRQERIERTLAQQQTQQKADADPWSPAKIVINLDARCPVVTVLGYFAAFATAEGQDAEKQALARSRFTMLQQAAKPIADEVKKIAATNTFAGRAFPAALEPRLNVLCAELYGVVGKIYGDDALAEVKKYAATLAQGVVVK